MKFAEQWGKYGKSAFYSQAYTFQNRETRIWRGDVKKASVIIPPLSAQDIKGNTKVRVDFEERTIEIAVGKGSLKKSIRFAKVNTLPFKDLFRFARDKLTKLNLFETRFAANERREREQKISVEVLESITGICGDDESEMNKEGFSRFGF